MKNVLFVTYYWPPAGGATVNRILRFYKYLPEFGWNPIILTIGNGVYPFIDNTLENEVRESSEVFKTNGDFKRKLELNLSPYGFTDVNNRTLKSRVVKILKYNVIPDNRIYWYPKAISQAKEIIKNYDVDLIFSSSPPQTNHLISSRISNKFKIPWVADLRDPWTETFWLKNEKLRNKYVHSLDKKIEKRVLNNASHLVTVVPDIASYISTVSDNEVSVIYNGYDEELYQKIEVEKRIKDDFVITYAGSMSYNHRPVGFFNNLIKLRKTNANLFDQIKVQFIGNFPDFLNKMISEYDLQNVTSMIPYMDMKDVIVELQKSHLLLVNGLHGINHGAIPSKLFDCIGAGVPILAYGLDLEANQVLMESKAGRNFDFFDEEFSSEFIEDVYHRRFQINNTSTSKKFSRRNQTQQLAQIFDDVWNRRNH